MPVRIELSNVHLLLSTAAVPPHHRTLIPDTSDQEQTDTGRLPTISPAATSKSVRVPDDGGSLTLYTLKKTA